MRWLIDGYNVVRNGPLLSSAERVSLESGRDALCRLLGRMAQVTGDEFTVVFDGARSGGTGRGAAGVRVVFSSARERADDVLARMARQGGAVVSNDREVRRAAVRAGAIAVRADEFLRRVESALSRYADISAIPDQAEEDDEDEKPAAPRKGNPRRLGKKARAAARALGRLAPPPARPSER